MIKCKCGEEINREKGLIKYDYNGFAVGFECRKCVRETIDISFDKSPSNKIIKRRGDKVAISREKVKEAYLSLKKNNYIPFLPEVAKVSGLTNTTCRKYLLELDYKINGSGISKDSAIIKKENITKIVTAYHKFLEKNNKIPQLNELSKITGLSPCLVQKRLSQNNLDRAPKYNRAC